MSGKYTDKIKSLPIHDCRFDAHKLKAKGSDVLFASYPAGTSIPPHKHDTDNHGIITRGELKLNMIGKEKQSALANGIAFLQIPFILPNLK